MRILGLNQLNSEHRAVGLVQYACYNIVTCLHQTKKMAGSGAPIYTPLTWPVGYVAAAINKDDDEKPQKVWVSGPEREIIRQ